jgi:hypothetical protein
MVLMSRAVERLALRISEVFQISVRRPAIQTKTWLPTVTVQTLPSKLARIYRRMVK